MKLEKIKNIEKFIRKEGIEEKKMVDKIYCDETKLKELYLNKQLCQKDIALLFGVSPPLIHYYLHKFRIPAREQHRFKLKYFKKKFSGDILEKAYIMGLRDGDLGVQKKGNQIQINSNTTKFNQVRMLMKVFKKYGHFWFKKNKETFYTTALLDKSFSFLLE
jgi:hypothetical protein